MPKLLKKLIRTYLILVGLLWLASCAANPEPIVITEDSFCDWAEEIRPSNRTISYLEDHSDDEQFIQSLVRYKLHYEKFCEQIK